MKQEVKVFFVQKIGDDEFETESLWCNRIGENFMVDNIPFIAKRIALGDIVRAEYDEEDESYYFDDFVEVSGNSTIRIILLEDESIISEIREHLKLFGCETEVFLHRKIVAVNVPKEVNYYSIKEYLDHGELNKIWTYEESCLAHPYNGLKGPKGRFE